MKPNMVEATATEKRTKNFLFGGRGNTYRLFCLVAGLLVLFLRYTAPGPLDPEWLRFALGGYFFAAILASIVVPALGKRVGLLFTIGAAGMSMWLSYLLYLNGFATIYMTGYYVMSVSCSLIFSNRKYVAIFTGAAAASLLAASIAHGGLDTSNWAFVALNGVIYGSANIAVGIRASAKTEIDNQLRRSLALQEAAVESSSDAVLMVDQDGNYIKANAAYLKMWHITAEMIAKNRQAETYGIAIKLVKDVDTLSRLWSNPGGNLAIGEVKRMELVDGRMIEFYWRPIIQVDDLIGRIWYFSDITERYRAESQLLARERLLRRHNEMLMEFAATFTASAGNLEAAFREITHASTDLLEVDTVGVWFFDQGSQSMRLGVQYDRLTARFTQDVKVNLVDHIDYFSELFKNRVLSIRDTREKQYSREFAEGRYSGKAAALMHAQIRARGECIGVLTFEVADRPRSWTTEEINYAASLADLVSVSMATEEKQHAQQNLTNSLAILQAIFDLSETGIVVEDNDHNIINYNELYLKIFNMTKEFIDNEPYKVLVQHCLAQLKNSHSYVEGLEKLKVRPGMEFAGIMEFHDGKFVERYSKAINVNGELKGRVWFYLDITDRKLKENELINRNFELDSFVYRASHDLKAPLNSIMGLISLIRSEQELEMVMRYINMMDKSVQKLDEFIKQLTQFSQDVRLKVVRKSIHFEDMIQDSLDVLKFMDNAQRLSVTLDVEQSGEFYSDPVRLGIVVSNLISNAIKYQDLKKPNSYLKVTVRANGQNATLAFEDNGLGISQEHLDRVFDLFFRASVQASGTGLGLYITHNAVQKLGGELKVNSELGKGTTFSMALPCMEAGAADEDGAEGDPTDARTASQA